MACIEPDYLEHNCRECIFVPKNLDGAMRLLTSIVLLSVSVSLYAGDNISRWMESDSFRFEIVQGYLKPVIKELMYDETIPMPDGLFTVGLYFNYKDSTGKEHGCGLYCDNQWGGNDEEVYCFIPLNLDVLGDNHVRLSRSTSRPVLSNSPSDPGWTESSEGLQKILAELCDAQGWYVEFREGELPAMSEWVLRRADSPEEKVLYYDTYWQLTN